MNSVDPPREFHASRLFWQVFAATLAAKCVLAYVVPLTGDEAYFALWGIYPDYGYYDHPPMIGWWLWPLLQLGRAVLLVRLPAILVPLAVALLLRRALQPLDAVKADLAGTLFLLSPLNMVQVITTTDTPLILFSTLATVFVFRNFSRGRQIDALIAGLFLGAAFLSKYFAVLLGAAYLVLYLVFARGRRGWLSLALIVAGALPGIVVNVVWNHEHGWTNLLFNVVNRHGSAGFSWENPLAFVLVTAFWLGPGILYVLGRSRRELKEDFAPRWAAMQRTGTIVFVIAAAVPGAVFFALSFARNVGFHWLMAFYPFVFVVLFACLGASQLRRMLRPMGWYGTMLLLVVLVVLALPDSWFRSLDGFDSYVLSADAERVIEAARSAHGADGAMLASDSYTKAAMMEFYSGQHVPVLGRGSFNGRHGDILTDFRALDGQDFLVIGTSEARLTAGMAWFETAELKAVDVDGARFFVLWGRGLDYAAYREDVLRGIAELYYRVPRSLAPVLGSGPSEFLDRYEFERPEPR